MKQLICLSLICIVFMIAAKNGSAVRQQSLSEEEAFQLGVDAYVYGYPLLVMDSVRRVIDKCCSTSGQVSADGSIRPFPLISRCV